MINKLSFTTKSVVLSVLSLMTIGYLSLSMVKDPVHETVIPSQAGIVKDFKFPIQFEQNEGQTDTDVRYLTRGPGYTFYFTPQEIAMVLTNRQADKTALPAILKMQFIDANSNPTIKGLDELCCKSNYFIGNDRNAWRSNISNYRKVAYKDLYPGIDAIFYGNPDQLEYDLCVAPGANPSLARLRLEGAEELLVDKEGNLCIHLGDSQELCMQKPFVYQLVRGEKVAIDAQFTLLAKNEVGFELGHYDGAQELVIDPVLVYSTYLGGSGGDIGSGIAVDSNGSMYVVGLTRSANFPIKNAFQASLLGSQDAFITKFDSSGTNLIYSTYLGGSGNSSGNGITVDESGNAYVTGWTDSVDFPIVNAFQGSLSGLRDVFVTKLDATGSNLIYSTYLGGGRFDEGWDIAIDGDHNVYITGKTTSLNFPIKNAFQSAIAGLTNAFITKFDATGSSLIYSTYLGGNVGDEGQKIIVDNSGNVYVTGQTQSTNFPLKNPFQGSRSGGTDVFITKFDATGSNLIYSTYLGGSDLDIVSGIAIDNSDNIYVSGWTSSANFPLMNPFQGFLKGTRNGFITKFDSSGTNLIYSTYLGGNDISQINGIAIDSNGHVYVIGHTSSTDFPVKNAFQTSLSGSEDAFITKLDATGSSLIYSSYFGGTKFDAANGIALDSVGNAYLVGQTSSSNFPVTANAFQLVLTGLSNDAFVSKFAIGTPAILSMSPTFGPETGGTTVVITGVNFSNTTMVDFGGIAATFVIDSDTQITAISPAGTGTVPVTVTGIGGTSIPTPAGLFSYQVTTTTALFASPNPAVVGETVMLTGTVMPPSSVGTISFFDGTALLGTASLSNGTATLTFPFLVVGSHSLTAIYSGSDDLEGSVSSPVILIIKASIAPPSHLRGKQEANRFLSQTEFINHLTWDAPSLGLLPVSYKIYRDANLKHAIAIISSSDRLEFVDHNRKKGQTYTYYIVSVDQFGNGSVPATVTVSGR